MSMSFKEGLYGSYSFGAESSWSHVFKWTSQGQGPQNITGYHICQKELPGVWFKTENLLH